MRREDLIEKYCQKRLILDIGSYEQKLTRGIGLDIKVNENVNIKCDAQELPIKNNVIDTIFAGEIIEHLPNPGKFLLECKRVFKTNAKIIITTPNARSLKKIDKEDHLFCFLLEQLERFVSRYFKIIGGYVNVYRRNLLFKFICELIPNFSWHVYVVGKKC